MNIKINNFKNITIKEKKIRIVERIEVIMK